MIDLSIFPHTTVGMSGACWDWHFRAGWWPDRRKFCPLRIATFITHHLRSLLSIYQPLSHYTLTPPTTTTPPQLLPADNQSIRDIRIFSSQRRTIIGQSIYLPANILRREIYSKYRAARSSFCLLAPLSRRSSLWDAYPLLMYTVRRMMRAQAKKCPSCPPWS